MSLSSREVGCVVITGSTKGIGLALAHAFLDLGCSVVIAGRNAEHLKHALGAKSCANDVGHCLYYDMVSLLISDV